MASSIAEDVASVTDMVADAEVRGLDVDVGQNLALIAKFNGKWSRAQIYNGVLTWEEGEDVPIKVTSSRSFQMCYFDENGKSCIHRAELHEDSNLRWDDGDIWHRRKSAFEGYWPQARIDGNVLTWNEGEEVEIFPIGTSSFRMFYYNKDSPHADHVFHAELQGDGRLRWDDNDVWIRTKAESHQSALERRRAPRCASHDHVARVQAHVKEETRDTAVVGRGSARGPAKCETSGAPNCQPRSKTVAALAPKDRHWYQGIVTQFRGSYGFVYCEKAAALFPGIDMMVHKNDCDFRPRQGDEIRFQLAENQHGNPQAVKVTRTPLQMDARDWFKARHSGLSNRSCKDSTVELTARAASERVAPGQRTAPPNVVRSETVMRPVSPRVAARKDGSASGCSNKMVPSFLTQSQLRPAWALGSQRRDAEADAKLALHDASTTQKANGAICKRPRCGNATWDGKPGYCSRVCRTLHAAQETEGQFVVGGGEAC